MNAKQERAYGQAMLLHERQASQQRKKRNADTYKKQAPCNNRSMIMHVSHNQARVLNSLKKRGPSTAKQIAARENMNQNSVASYMSALFSGGLVDKIKKVRIKPDGTMRNIPSDEHITQKEVNAHRTNRSREHFLSQEEADEERPNRSRDCWLYGARIK
jgi:DNA-binding CsgD family transcriptional regulator|tara:strand:- start:466 stop:942 length:477 start_codon:yes stop_codon:yes gene_type:complete